MCQDCQTLYGVSGHLDEPTASEVSDHQNSREFALVELTVRTLALALRLEFTEDQTRKIVEALVMDDRRFDGHHDLTTAALTPERVLDQVRLFGDLSG